jgi:hypothetical protein
MDVLERVDAATTPDNNQGSIHGTGFTGGTGLGTQYQFPSGQTAATFSLLRHDLVAGQRIVLRERHP